MVKPDEKAEKIYKPGTIVSIDQKTGEKIYSEPGSSTYSTALMFADFVIELDGTEKPVCKY